MSLEEGGKNMQSHGEDQIKKTSMRHSRLILLLVILGFKLTASGILGLLALIDKREGELSTFVFLFSPNLLQVSIMDI